MIPLPGPFLRVIFLLFWAGHLCFTAAGQVAAPEALTIDQGLSQGMIYDVLQTKDGFLWVGTKDGLNRYDGYNFKVWSNNPYYSFTLPDNTVTALLEDSRGWLWLGSESQGISMFDRKSERFYHVSLPVKIAGSNQVLSDVRSITEDREGRIWVANRGAGIYCLTVPGNWKTGFPDTPDISNWCTVRMVQSSGTAASAKGLQEEFSGLCVLEDGTIWAGSSRGVYQINPQTLKGVFVSIAPEPYSKEVVSAMQMASGDFWGANRSGIFNYANHGLKPPKQSSSNSTEDMKDQTFGCSNFCCYLNSGFLNKPMKPTFNGLSEGRNGTRKEVISGFFELSGSLGFSFNKFYRR